jgi:hypothetical protein
MGFSAYGVILRVGPSKRPLPTSGDLHPKESPSRPPDPRSAPRREGKRIRPCFLTARGRLDQLTRLRRFRVKECHQSIVAPLRVCCCQGCTYQSISEQRVSHRKHSLGISVPECQHCQETHVSTHRVSAKFEFHLTFGALSQDSSLKRAKVILRVSNGSEDREIRRL